MRPGFVRLAFLTVAGLLIAAPRHGVAQTPEPRPPLVPAPWRAELEPRAATMVAWTVYPIAQQRPAASGRHR